jgi:hypothetical protein
MCCSGAKKAAFKFVCVLRAWVAPAVLRSAEHKRYVAGQMSCSHKKSKILLDFCVLNTYCKSMEKQRIFAGEITTVEKAEWLKHLTKTFPLPSFNFTITVKK